jgi:hypothetical protein
MYIKYITYVISYTTVIRKIYMYVYNVECVGSLRVNIVNYGGVTRGRFVSNNVGMSIWSMFPSSCGPVRFLAFGDDCFKHSISLNTTCAPPPLVGNISPYKKNRALINVMLIIKIAL